jgi:N6-L-threonylcarbamoyladenine synthase
MGKTRKAIQEHRPLTLALAGGVSANKVLRKQLQDLANNQQLQCLIPSFEYCTDNAAMICMAGHFMLESGKTLSLEALPFSKTHNNP